MAAFATFALGAASAATRFVDITSGSPTPPFTNWSTAAQDIQSAVDAASDGDTVLVTNGIYASGGRAVYGTMTNRVAINRAITVQSVNGPDVTIIRGAHAPGATNGDGAIRCAYLTNGATLIGFTLTNGATQISGAATPAERDGAGGGLWSEGSGAVVSNCTIVGNFAHYGGGGASGGTLADCRLLGNWALQIFGTGGGGQGGGAYSATLNNCTVLTNAAYNGGGASSCVLIDCQVATNSAFNEAGGAYGGNLSNCVVSGNAGVFGGGVSGSKLDHCALIGNRAAFPPGIPGEAPGGGAYQSTLTCCVLASNRAYVGGAAYRSTLRNCILTGNNGGARGGGVYFGTLNNCTLTGNSATEGGGEHNAALTNCIIYSNSVQNYAYDGPPNGRINYCCTTPLPDSGFGNITNPPIFIDYAGGNLRPQTNSPCINAGNNAYSPPGPDPDGNPRIVGGTVDIGAYEFQGSGSAISYSWLQQYGLPTDGSADLADADGDGMTNYGEWRGDTNPTNALSVLRMVGALRVANTVQITWESVPTRNYTLEWTFGLNPPQFQKIAYNLAGQPGLTTYTQFFMGSPPSAPTFYRVSVQKKGESTLP